MNQHGESFWEIHERGGFMDVRRYLKMVERFVASGEIPKQEDEVVSVNKPWARFDDPLLAFLIRLMTDPTLCAKVKSGKAAGKIFHVTVGRFVVNCLHNTKFESKRSWTEYKASQDIGDLGQGDRRDWKSLVTDIGEKHEADGFDTSFFLRLFSAPGATEDKSNWEKLRHDWQEAMFRQLRRKEENWIAQRQQQVRLQLETAFRQMTEKMEKNSVSAEDAALAYDMMGGTWSETEFERHLQVIKLRDRYPMLDEIVKKMGRKADDVGNTRLTSAEGTDLMMEHSAGSDIEGITIGNDVNSLLPSEWAQCADESLEKLFVYKYLTRHLQVFRSRSNTKKPARHLNFNPARLMGPVIVCIDTSASMSGLPERVEKVLIEQLTALVEEEARDCFLIDFAVSVRPIDLKVRQHNRLLDALGVTEKEIPRKEPAVPFINGGTSAKNMMETMFRLLDGKRYVNADVLWITDFDIPMNQRAYARKMADYQRTGTRFYGLRITDSELSAENNPWEPYFNKIYTLKYRRIRRY